MRNETAADFVKRHGRTDSYLYQILDRMRGDCDYFLNYGNRCITHLWANNPAEQIEYMKTIWNYLEVKPVWLTMEQIENYEKQMVLSVEQYKGLFFDIVDEIRGYTDLDFYDKEQRKYIYEDAARKFIYVHGAEAWKSLGFCK